MVFVILLCNILICSCSSDERDDSTVGKSWTDTITVASHVYTYSSENNIRVAFYLKKHNGNKLWQVMGERLTGLDLLDGYEYVLAVKGSLASPSQEGGNYYMAYNVVQVLSAERKESSVGSLYTRYTGEIGSDGSSVTPLKWPPTTIPIAAIRKLALSSCISLRAGARGSH